MVTSRAAAAKLSSRAPLGLRGGGPGHGAVRRPYRARSSSKCSTSSAPSRRRDGPQGLSPTDLSRFGSRAPGTTNANSFIPLSRCLVTRAVAARTTRPARSKPPGEDLGVGSPTLEAAVRRRGAGAPRQSSTPAHSHYDAFSVTPLDCQEAAFASSRDRKHRRCGFRLQPEGSGRRRPSA